MIQINDINKFYDDKLILKDISFNVGKNEIVALVGPNGCGKSTLLKIIASLESKNGGQITFAKNNVKSGVVFQDHRHSLFPWQTVAQNIGFAVAQHITDVSEQKQKINAILEKLNLTAHQNKYPYELSGGMSQLCAFAKVVALEPDYFLLDEPFCALDYHSAFSLQKIFLRLWQEMRRPVIVVTHSLEEAVLLSDRIIILSRPPTQIVEIIENKLPRPREITQLTWPHAHEIKDRLIDIMHGFIV